MNRKAIIILVNFNKADDTIECINSIIKSDFSSYFIVVVDNASTDNSFQNFLTYHEIKINENNCVESLSFQYYKEVLYSRNLVFIKTTENLGFAGGNNFGVGFIQRAGIEYDYIWFLNNDTIIREDALRILVERMDFECVTNSRTGILGCKLLRYYHPDRLQGVGGLYNKLTATCKNLGNNELDFGQYDIKNVAVDYPIGASLFVRKDFIDAVGLMQEDYFLYFEELDWVTRGKKKGFDYGFEYKANVYHKEGESTKENQKRLGRVADHCQIRNRILFTYRYYPEYLITVIPITFGSVINRILRGQFKRAVELTVIIFKISFGILFKKYGQKEP
jgi:GT2 family glycosyltransferase